MMSDINELEKKMREQLRQVASILDPLQKAAQSIDLLTIILQELKMIIKNHDQKDHTLNIELHKKRIPPFYAEYIYYASLFNLQSAKPFGNRQKEYFIKESERIENWFAENETFLRYYRSGRCDLDHEYFLPGANKPQNHIDLYSPMLEDSFCSRYSFIAAMGMAYQRLQKELTLLIISVSGSSFSGASLRWTLSKTDLTELIYALYACGAFNKCKATIKDITRFFEETLHISLGNTSVTFQEILRRKDSAAFLTRLSDAFDSYIDQVEQKNIR